MKKLLLILFLLVGMSGFANPGDRETILDEHRHMVVDTDITNYG